MDYRVTDLRVDLDSSPLDSVNWELYYALNLRDIRACLLDTGLSAGQRSDICPH